MSMTVSAGPLAGLTVLDLSTIVSGGTATAMLADFGAEVLKIEHPRQGDPLRSWGPFIGGQSVWWKVLSRNKMSVTLNLSVPKGQQLLGELVRRADVLVENFRPGTLERWGLGPDRLMEINPRLVILRISGFGQTGPYSDRAAMDVIVQAESGMISVTGEPGGRGVRCGVSIADLTAGMNAAFAIVVALHARGRSGRGQYIDVSLLEGQLGLLAGAIAMYRADGVVPGPMGTAYRALLPYQTFRTRTEDLALAIGSDSLWQTFCPLAGLEHLRDDPRYRTNADRNRNRESLLEALQQRLLEKTYAEWEALLVPAGIPMGRINTLDRVAEHPQARARGVFAECEHPVAGKITTVSPCFHLSETPGGVRSPAPLLGQHTDEVLREELGLGESEIDGLRKRGAIGSAR